MREITFLVLKIVDLELHRLPDGGKRAIDANHRVGANCTGGICLRSEHVRDRCVEIDTSAAMIEHDSHIWITLRSFDHSRVERCATDRADTFFWIDVVRREMQLAGFVVNHSATHGNRMLQDLIRNPKLLERINATGRDSQIDRTSADDVAFSRIGTSLVKIDIVSASPEVGTEQSAG